MNETSAITSDFLRKTKETLSQNSILFLAVIFLFFLFIIFTFGGVGFFGGGLSRVFGLIILIIFGYMLINWTTEYVGLDEDNVLDEDEEYEDNLKIKEISDMLERASEKKTVSQDLLHNKIKDMFIMKLREKRNLTNEEVQNLLKDPAESRRVIDDEMISNFILALEKNDIRSNSSSKKDNKPFPSLTEERDEKKYKKEYKMKIKELIERINAWD